MSAARKLDACGTLGDVASSGLMTARARVIAYLRAKAPGMSGATREDIAQATIESLLAKIQSGVAPISLEALAVSIAKGKLSDERKKQQRAERRVTANPRRMQVGRTLRASVEQRCVEILTAAMRESDPSRTWGEHDTAYLREELAEVEPQPDPIADALRTTVAALIKARRALVLRRDGRPSASSAPLEAIVKASERAIDLDAFAGGRGWSERARCVAEFGGAKHLGREPTGTELAAFYLLGTGGGASWPNRWPNLDKGKTWTVGEVLERAASSLAPYPRGSAKKTD